MFAGVDVIRDRQDFYERLTLEVSSIGMSLPVNHRQFLDQIDEDKVNRGIRDGSSPWVLECIRRFTSIEANCSDKNHKGLGRVSEYGFPRLGGVLYKEAKKSECDLAMIASATERMIHSGYLVCVSLSNFGKRVVAVKDIDDLWTEWIPLAYSIADDATNVVYNNCAIDDFWINVLDKSGFQENLKKLKTGKNTEIGRSIGGLATTGVGLFLAERPN